MINIKGTNLSFIHPPKCGGTSVAKALERKNLIQKVTELKGTHSTIKDFKDFGKEYLIIVRNPYSRFFSYYHYLIEWSQKRIDGELSLKGRTIDYFQKIIDKLKEIKFEGWVSLLKTKQFPFHMEKEYNIPMDAFRCQTNWYLNQTTKPLYIHKVEENTIWPFLEKQTGMKFAPIHEKKSTYRTVSGYTDEQAQLVYEYFKQDFDLLGYKKEDYKRA